MVATAMKDALDKAGIDTATVELQTLAAEAIRAHAGSAADATPKFAELMRKRPELLTALARNYLLRIAGEMQVSGEPITLPPDKPRDVKVHGYTVEEHHRRGHRRARRRTAEEKASAMRVAKQVTAAMKRSIFDRRIIDGRPLGDLQWGELGMLVQSKAINAASYLRLGITEIEDLIIMGKLKTHITVEDHRTKVRDVARDAQTEQFELEARALAPLLIERAAYQTRQTILHHDEIPMVAQ